VKRWLNHVEAAFSHRQPLNPADGEHAELCSLIRGNVVAQLHNLRTITAVKRGLEAETLQVFGWYYDILTGTIEQYDEKDRKFVELG
jgi:carbonic anhydrase